MGLYAGLLRPLLFQLDAETAHHSAMALGAAAGFAGPALRALLAVSDPRLRMHVAGLDFSTPIGLAAGFDKNGQAVSALAGLDFGFIEIGSLSASFSPGNKRPRLFRLPQDRAIAVAYGVPNDGAQAVAARLKSVRLPVPLGINIVKTNHGPGAPPESDDAIIADYVAPARVLAPCADYLMFNLSCPNTAEGKDFFADRARLDAWLAALASEQLTKPVFLKVSPLGGVAAIEQLLAAAEPHAFIRGFMFNLPPVKPEQYLTTPRPHWATMPGAVSGPPCAPLLDTCLRECYRRMDRTRYALFASGGIATGADAYRKIRAGASLVSMYTALIYDGPLAVRRVTRELLRLLERDGINGVADAAGIDNR
jgi:dihydroorotate dehydrogenase (fumarate)/dihydroorotate dehydrogenase